MKEQASPRMPLNACFWEPFLSGPADPAVHIKALLDVKKVAQCIIPKDELLLRPMIRHPDLSPSNIFVEGTEVTSIIDWQHAVSLPIFVQALIPQHFQFYGDDKAAKIEKPKLPSDFESLPEDEKMKELELQRRRENHIFFTVATVKSNFQFYKAMNDPMVLLRGKLYDHARSPWEGDNATLRNDLLLCADHWGTLRAAGDSDGTTCPVQFDEDERNEVIAFGKSAVDAEESAVLARQGIGISAGGWVASEDYAQSVENAQKLKEIMVNGAESSSERNYYVDNWPFGDHEEIP